MTAPAKPEKAPSPLKKDITLLLLGALISASTAFVSDYLHEKRDAHKSNLEKKMELNDMLSKDLSKRIFLTFEGYKARRSGDTATLQKLLEKYTEAKEEWNLKRYSYFSLLRNYYGEAVELRYKSTIYNPMVTLGQQFEYNRIDASFPDAYSQLDIAANQFISDIFKKLEN